MSAESLRDLEVQVAAAKVSKYTTAESGDTLEVIERPFGGLSAVLADGQRSGRAAKRISNIVVRKAISLLADGVRDGAVARAAHDYLRTHRGGRVSATLNILSVDLVTRTVVISRNSHCPVLVAVGDELTWLDEPSEAIGIYRLTRPVITERPLVPGMTVVVFTDGIWAAGQRYGERLDLAELVRTFLITANGDDAQVLADRILAEAVRLDRGRPADDMSVLVLRVGRLRHEERARRMTVRFPLVG
ncbi:MAG TPA: serine/threonine-protein phosphatase [Anaerolineae bacterium]|nr:serine/threonine-protein phosphatase [Anaerolineae bacterium]